MPSVLFITAAPDRRRSTQALHDTFVALARRDDVQAETWFLRCAWNEKPWRGSRIADDLRTWPPAAWLDRTGFTRLAGRVRGLRLRAWLRRLDPDVVVLDDGLGDRLLTHCRPGIVRVVRHNARPPADSGLEQVTSDRANAVLAPPGLTPPDLRGVQLITEYERRDDYDGARRAGTDDVRRRERVRLGLPAGSPVITGWGDDGWIDGPDMFVRALWVLERRHGIRAHGIWFGSAGDEHERDRLQAEAQRCGLDDRFQHVPRQTLDAEVCGDAVLLPYRDRADDEAILLAICSGAAVVTFPVTALTDPSVRVVEHLDVEAAGAELATALGEDRTERWNAALHRLDLQSLVDAILELGRGSERS